MGGKRQQALMRTQWRNPKAVQRSQFSTYLKPDKAAQFPQSSQENLISGTSGVFDQRELETISTILPVDLLLGSLPEQQGLTRCRSPKSCIQKSSARCSAEPTRLSHDTWLPTAFTKLCMSPQIDSDGRTWPDVPCPRHPCSWGSMRRGYEVRAAV